jgi:hypothetical protein
MHLVIFPLTLTVPGGAYQDIIVGMFIGIPDISIFMVIPHLPSRMVGSPKTPFTQRSDTATVTTALILQNIRIPAR